MATKKKKKKKILQGFASVIVLLSAVSHYPNSHKRAPPSTGSSGKWSPEAKCTLRRLRERNSECMHVCVCVCVIQSEKDIEREREREGEREGGRKELSDQHSHWYPVFTLTVKTLLGCSNVTLCSTYMVPPPPPFYEIPPLSSVKLHRSIQKNKNNCNKDAQ